MFVIQLNIQRKKNYSYFIIEGKNERKKKKKRCGIRYTVKVAKDTDRKRERVKKNFRELKTHAQITYHLTVVNQIQK